MQVFLTIALRINLILVLTYLCFFLFIRAEGDTVTEMQEESPYSSTSKSAVEQSNIFVIPSKRAEESTARPLITSKTHAVPHFKIDQNDVSCAI